MNTDTIQFFQAWSHWKMDKAKQFAEENGLATKTEDGILFIEVRYDPARFCIEDIYGPYKGFYRMMKEWNGWQCPYFTKQVAEQIVDDFMKNAEPGTPSFKWDNEALIYTDEMGESETIEPETIVVNGENVTVYDLSLGWIWDLYKVDETYEKVAVEFSKVLASWLSHDEMLEVVKLNDEEEDSSICHSHDFCDSNMAMAEAFEKVIGREFSTASETPEEDRQSSIDTAIWNNAWTIAKENKFYLG